LGLGLSPGYTENQNKNKKKDKSDFKTRKIMSSRHFIPPWFNAPHRTVLADFPHTALQ